VPFCTLVVRSAALAALLAFVPCAPAAAQGGTGLRQFGVWLDDATVSPKGQGWATVGVGYYRSPFSRQWDTPSLDLGLGVARRVQVALSAPVSRLEVVGEPATRSVGDVYVATKVAVLDPAASERGYGIALAPLIEILSSSSVVEGGGRVHWALPVTLERRFESFRTYGSVGYFSRGAVFGSAALEVPMSDKITGTFAMTHTRSLEEDTLSDALELARTRLDVSAAATYFAAENMAVYASVGRTISELDQNGSSLALSAGVSVGFQHRFKRRR
jgi:hypothetical protein